VKARIFGIVTIAMTTFAMTMMVMPAWSANPDWPATMTVVTASPGGTYHV
jgi:hypothetical protein